MRGGANFASNLERLPRIYIAWSWGECRSRKQPNMHAKARRLLSRYIFILQHVGSNAQETFSMTGEHGDVGSCWICLQLEMAKGSKGAQRGPQFISVSALIFKIPHSLQIR
jgi:hypothetical protein